MRAGAVALLSLAAAACNRGAPRYEPASDCGYPELRSGTCKITLSGALTEILPCSVDPVYDVFRKEFVLRLGVESSDSARVGGRVSITVRFGGEPRVATYSNTAPGTSSAMYVYSSTYLAEWSETVGGPDAPQGSHTLAITRVGTPYCISQSKAYPGMQGRLDATLPASASSAASGKVILRATF